MLRYALKRILLAIPVALAVSLVCFTLIHVAPGDPVSAFLPPEASQQTIDEVKARFGLDQPLPIQYGKWLREVAAGNLGKSIATGRPVATEVRNALSNTFLVALPAAVVGVCLGIVLGLLSGYWRGGVIDKTATFLSIVGVSVPHYWLAMVLVVLFSVHLNLLPAFGAGPAESDVEIWRWDRLRYLILPALAMSVVPLGIIARTVKAVVADTLSQEFVQALRAKGLTEVEVFRHVVKNSAPTSLAVIGVQIGYLLAGSILIETVFAWPGTGFLLNGAIFQRDIPLLQGIVLVLAMVFVLLNTVVDILQAVIDPRISRS